MRITDYLKDKGIRIIQSGKNVGKNFIGINCIFPDCADRSNHLGIHKTKFYFKCLKCGKKGSLKKLVATIEKCSFQQAKEIIKSYGGVTYIEEEEKSYELCLPDKCRPITRNKFPRAIYEYLKNRRFDPYMLAEKYGLLFGGNSGYFKNRLVVPIIKNREVVCATGIDIFMSKNGIKYKHLPNEPDNNGVCAGTSAKDLLYNIDNVGKIMVVTEGIMDVWRLGDGAVATMGTAYTSRQVQLILLTDTEKTFLLFDSGIDAQRRAKELEEELSIQGKNVERLVLTTGDPDDMTQIEADDLMIEILKEHS